MQNFPYLFSTLWTIVTLSPCNVMCGSNLLSCVPPSGLFHFFHSAKYICMWKVKIPRGVCTTFHFTVEWSQRLKNLFKNSTMVPDASNLVWSNLWTKLNVVHTPFLIFSLFAIMCILQNEKSEIIPRGVRTTANLNHTLCGYLSGTCTYTLTSWLC